MSEETRPGEPADTATVDNATRDAIAIVASLRKGDKDSASLLLGFYTDPKETSALCGALAAFAAACLTTIDNVREHFHVTGGVILPSGDDMLKTVMLKLAK